MNKPYAPFNSLQEFQARWERSIRASQHRQAEIKHHMSYVKNESWLVGAQKQLDQEIEYERKTQEFLDRVVAECEAEGKL